MGSCSCTIELTEFGLAVSKCLKNGFNFKGNRILFESAGFYCIFTDN